MNVSPGPSICSRPWLNRASRATSQQAAHSGRAGWWRSCRLDRCPWKPGRTHLNAAAAFGWHDGGQVAPLLFRCGFRRRRKN